MVCYFSLPSASVRPPAGLRAHQCFHVPHRCRKHAVCRQQPSSGKQCKTSGKAEAYIKLQPLFRSERSHCQKALISSVKGYLYVYMGKVNASFFPVHVVKNPMIFTNFSIVRENIIKICTNDLIRFSSRRQSR